MTVSLPPELRAIDGHPQAALAVQLWNDLARIGLPVHLATSDHPEESGVVIAPDDPGFSVCWRVPGHRAAEAAAKIDFAAAMAEEADASSAADHVLHAATVLTASLAGILVSLGYSLGGSYLGPGSRFVVTGTGDDAELIIQFAPDDQPG